MFPQKRFYNRSKYNRLTCTCRHLRHHGPIKAKSLLYPHHHILLIIKKFHFRHCLLSTCLINAHGSHKSHGSFDQKPRTSFLNTNNPNNTNIFWHTDLTDLLAYGLLLLWDSWICNITQKMTSVSHAKHRQIREICEIRVL